MAERNKKHWHDDIPELPHEHPFYTDEVVCVGGFKNQELESLKGDEEKFKKKGGEKNG